MISGYFQLAIEIGPKGYLLHIHEEYKFRDYRLAIKTYSYNLLDRNKNSVMRADSLPYHKVDYKGKKLTNFPHHLHDNKGKLCQFSGKIEDFIKTLTQFFTTAG